MLLFTDPCLMNGHLQQTMPSMLASEDLTIDAEPSHEDAEEGPARGQHPPRHKHPSAAGSEGGLFIVRNYVMWEIGNCQHCPTNKG